jgi:hypothetical protein
MEFLGPPTQFQHFGYPSVVFYIVAIIGMGLLFFRPYWAFLFSLFCLSARNFHAAVDTRTTFLGPYLNLNDLLLWIALFAMIVELLRKGKKLWMPKILAAIFALLFIGDLQSLVKYGFIEEVLRRMWSTAIFPILFLVGANLVNDEKRAHSFYWILFWGAVTASLQHMFFIRTATSIQLYSGEVQIRTISYIMSGGLFLVISAIFKEPDKSLGQLKSSLFYFGLALIGLSYLLSLTRGLYIYTFFALLALPVILKGNLKIPKTVYSVALVMVFALLIVKIVSPDLDLGQILNDRFNTFSTKDTFSKSYETRWEGAQTELNLWLNNSSILLGVGSSLPPELELTETESRGALYHVAFSAYLAHYGILGLLVYGVFLPSLTIKVAKKYFPEHALTYSSSIALIAIACSLLDIIGLTWSQHHLGAISHIPSLIYGAMWGLYRGHVLEKKQALQYQPVLTISPKPILRYNGK